MSGIEGSGKHFIQRNYQEGKGDKREAVTETLNNLSSALNEPDFLLVDHDALWESEGRKDKTISREQFREIFSSLDIEYGDEVNFDLEDIDLLFDILNSKNVDGSLSYDEYEFLMNGEGKISGSSLWHKLAFSAGALDRDVDEDAANVYRGSVVPSDYINAEDDSALEKVFESMTGTSIYAQIRGSKTQDLRTKLDYSETLSDSKIMDIATLIINDSDIGVEHYKNLMSESDYERLEEQVEKLSEDKSKSDSSSGTGSSENGKVISFAEIPFSRINSGAPFDQTATEGFKITPETVEAFEKAGIKVQEAAYDKPAIEQSQINFAQYLYQELGLSEYLSDDELAAFVANLPKTEEEQMEYIINLCKLDNETIKEFSASEFINEKLPKKDVEFSLSKEEIANYTKILNTNISYVNDCLLEEINERFGTTYTIESFDLDEGDSLAAVLWPEDGTFGSSLTKDKIEELLKKEE